MESWWSPLGAGLIVSAAIVAAAVLPKEAKPKRAPDHRPPRVEATLDLPGNSQVHIIAVPTGYMESSRCVVAVSAAGQTSVACTRRELDLADD